MRRTQIYLTDDQGDRIAEMARDLSISKAEVVRRILDQSLGTGQSEDEDRAVIAATAGVLADYPDWPEWLGDVRGRNADERLRSFGL